MAEEWISLEKKIRAVAQQSMQKKIDEHNARMKLTTKIMDEPKKPDAEPIKEEVEEVILTEEVMEEEPLEELMSSPDPVKAKMDAQRKQVMKQKEQLRLQLAQQKAAKQMQVAKEKGAESLEKIKEDDTEELTERAHNHVRTFRRATKLEKLHSTIYNRLVGAGDLAKAEKHRKKSAEYKRLAYFAKDNPTKLGEG